MSFGRLGEEEEKGLDGEVGEGFETALDLKHRSLTVPVHMFSPRGEGSEKCWRHMYMTPNVA